MRMLTVNDFKQKFPAFQGVADETVQTQLNESELLLNKELLGDKFPLILGYHVAHELSLEAGEGSTPIISRSIERGSITYQTIQNDTETLYYNATKYGKKFILFFKSNSSTFAMAICD